MARAALEWGVRDLAKKAGISANTKNGHHTPNPATLRDQRMRMMQLRPRVGQLGNSEHVIPFRQSSAAAGKCGFPSLGLAMTFENVYCVAYIHQPLGKVNKVAKC